MSAAVDGRRVRGDATRRRVARVAADIATTHGLDSISVGALAAAIGVSKSGILTVFGSREAIQVAAVTEARAVYLESVIVPAWDKPAGKARLRAIVDSWLAYLRAGVFPGGCFLAATSAEYGHRDGPVADAIRRLKREWLGLLEAEFRTAGSTSPARDAFAVDAFLNAGNVRYQLFGDDAELRNARSLARRTIG